MQLFYLIFSIYYENRKNGLENINMLLKDYYNKNDSELNVEFIRNEIKDKAKMNLFIDYLTEFFMENEQFNDSENDFFYNVKAIIIESERVNANEIDDVFDKCINFDIISKVSRYDEAIKVARNNDIGLIIINGKRDIEIIYNFASMVSDNKNKNIPVFWFSDFYLYFLVSDQLFKLYYA